MMMKAATFGMGCCGLLALQLACARVSVGGRGDGVSGTGGMAAPSAGRGGADTSGAGDASGSGRGGATGHVGPCSDGTGNCAKPDAAVCGLVKAPLDRLPPDVLIVLDRSNSMTGQVLPPGFDVTTFITCLLLQNCPMTNSKWVEMTKALNTSLAASAATVNYGLKFFPEDSACGVSDGAAVPIAPNNGTAIASAIALTLPGGHTPTASALASAGRYLTTLNRRNPRFVLLATDGEPTCDPDADTASVTETANLLAAGIPVFVIGIATAGRGDTTLNNIANAGGRARVGTPAYYPVETAADLSAAIAAIGGQIASCTFTVAKPDPPLDADNVAVDANGMRVPKSDTDGWRYGPNMTSIELTGSWCDRIQSGMITNIQATFACTGIVIP
jgi:hypothetical protein